MICIIFCSICLIYLIYSSKHLIDDLTIALPLDLSSFLFFLLLPILNILIPFLTFCLCYFSSNTCFLFFLLIIYWQVKLKIAITLFINFIINKIFNLKKCVILYLFFYLYNIRSKRTIFNSHNFIDHNAPVSHTHTLIRKTDKTYVPRLSSAR